MLNSQQLHLVSKLDDKLSHANEVREKLSKLRDTLLKDDITANATLGEFFVQYDNFLRAFGESVGYITEILDSITKD